MNHLFLSNNHFLNYKKFQNFQFLTILKVKMDHILPENRTSVWNFFWIFISKWQTTRKLIKSSKNVGGKWTHFCLGPKTEIGPWDPRFTLRSKIFVFRSSFLLVFLILVQNGNCIRKSLCLDLANLRNHIS